MGRFSGVWIVFFMGAGLACGVSTEDIPFQKGMCLAHRHSLEDGYGSENCRKQLEALKAINVTWVSITPFADQAQYNKPTLALDDDPTLSPDRVALVIDQAHEAGMKVLLNPHIWNNDFREHWRGEIWMENEADWKAWWEDYDRYILSYANLAQDKKVDLFCVGSELVACATGREADWRRLIREVRKVYTGPLIYAANWDEYDKIKFWDALDYAGIDFFPPLIDEASPDRAAIKSAMESFAHRVDAFHRKWKKPIVLTEIGYKSVEWTTSRPWEWRSGAKIDLDLQARAYEAALQVFPQQKWCRGMYWWKWYTAPRGGPNDSDFTPQGKPAEKVIAKYYGQ